MSERYPDELSRTRAFMCSGTKIDAVSIIAGQSTYKCTRSWKYMLVYWLTGAAFGPYTTYALIQASDGGDWSHLVNRIGLYFVFVLLFLNTAGWISLAYALVSKSFILIDAKREIVHFYSRFLVVKSHIMPFSDIRRIRVESLVKRKDKSVPVGFNNMVKIAAVEFEHISGETHRAFETTNHAVADQTAEIASRWVASVQGAS